MDFTDRRRIKHHPVNDIALSEAEIQSYKIYIRAEELKKDKQQKRLF
jgi:hypothetical protein